ncbi:MAG: hypothetical protein ACRD6W_10425 [Nitrososphaerales archaeon]
MSFGLSAATIELRSWVSEATGADVAVGVVVVVVVDAWVEGVDLVVVVIFRLELGVAPQPVTEDRQ